MPNTPPEQSNPSSDAAAKGQPKLSFFERLKGKRVYDDQELNDYAIDLILRMNTTAVARFEAARRFDRKNRTSTVSIIILSAYAVLFSMLSTFDKIISSEVKDVLALLSVFMSSLILTFSLFESSKRYDLKADNFLRSARIIQSVRDSLLMRFFSKKLTWEALQELERKYVRVLSNFPENHAHLDLRTSRDNLRKLKNWPRRKVWLEMHANIWMLPALSVVSPIVVVLLYSAIVILVPKALPPKNSSSAPVSISSPSGHGR